MHDEASYCDLHVNKEHKQSQRKRIKRYHRKTHQSSDFPYRFRNGFGMHCEREESRPKQGLKSSAQSKYCLNTSISITIKISKGPSKMHKSKWIFTKLINHQNLVHNNLQTAAYKLRMKSRNYYPSFPIPQSFFHLFNDRI